MCAVETDVTDETDEVLARWLAVLDEYVDAARSISSSSSLDTEFDDVEAAEPTEPELAAVAVVLGACAANHAPSPRNDAALTAPVMRRARRAGCGFLEGGMLGACAPRCKET